MRTNMVALVSLAVAISTFVSGCHHDPSATKVYGRASNPDRKARGLPVIPDTWIERRGGTMADWSNPELRESGTEHNPMHRYKEVFIDKSGNPVSEHDYYQSGRQYTAFGGDQGEMFPETLIIKYDFEAARAGKNPWSGTVNCGPLQKAYSDGLTLEEAEAVLKEWGLNRLNY